MFASTLRGMGIHVKAVCSFQPRQLVIPRPIARTVLFFHGLAGLENACDAGNVRATAWLPRAAATLCVRGALARRRRHQRSPA